MNEREKFEEKKEGSNYEKIGPTAWGVAWHRSLSDIKYAKEIFDELDEVVKPTEQTEIEYMESARESKIAPQIEARYKLIDKLMAENKTDQVIELAAGLVGRGLAMTEEDSSLRYVEVDLPEMAKNKRALLQSIFSKGIAKPQEGLHIENGNALDRDSLFAATRYFKNEPITVVHEGLLRYLNFDEKRTVANNIHALLEKFGGAWITSDITLKRVLSGERQKERDDNRKRVLSLSGIDIGANTFENEDEAKKFFEELGFSVERHGFIEVVDQLVSPAKIDLSRSGVEDLLRDPVVFVMRLESKS
jgi:O-methyltransferase involved in polyketide biosynthesis